MTSPTHPAPGAPAPRWGVTLPLPGLPLDRHRFVVERLPDLGYTDVWTAEGGGTDAFTPLAAAAAWSQDVRIATGIVPVQTRGPAVLAQTAATLAQLAPGRLLLGLGASVPAHVTDINGIPFDEPYKRTRDVLRFVTRALRGEYVSGDFDTFSITGYQLPHPPSDPVKVILGALRPGMLRLGFTEGDGAITNLLFPEDVPAVLDAVGPQPPGKELVVKVFVCPTEDTDFARRTARPFLAWILNREPYRRFHEWLGHGELLGPAHERWAAGDVAGAQRALPDEVVDALFVNGSPEECRERIRRYHRPGVTTIQLYVSLPPEVLASPPRLLDTLTRLGPAAS
ncbi:LLM class F420-dependent oxidoreductase [Streptomyces cocklensis]|jgi:probable F420-dependent oxidoreductase|uniref:LLM class F420-dependent oxidoreductase n=1 Tax=Actinacidiphila cocklensis TaxID=887465 RepID=A0A9W4GMZ3_9ACTN|nr:LLM class F420-dependent oxidoreductase [Actinacidiphila cocklensis]MDD1058641.1 LLM class F420-dependent oxidoreductase [Actinacidiphila cocklensis]WSX75151.1 LLM class F420-dependent oxidoreductase [Streptomyces sp. NBC_00899]CAG6390823.1 LLM class F420-dependent oxidoreductase [Actinacidiphila cocklensis]